MASGVRTGISDHLGLLMSRMPNDKQQAEPMVAQRRWPTWTRPHTHRVTCQDDSSTLDNWPMLLFGLRYQAGVVTLSRGLAYNCARGARHTYTTCAVLARLCRAGNGTAQERHGRRSAHARRQGCIQPGQGDLRSRSLSDQRDSRVSPAFLLRWLERRFAPWWSWCVNTIICFKVWR